MAFLLGNFLKQYKRSGFYVRRIFTNAVRTRTTNGKKLILLATGGVTVTCILFTVKAKAESDPTTKEQELSVLWNHTRKEIETEVSSSDNHQKMFKAVVPISWHETAAAIGALACIFCFIISPFSLLPIGSRWFILPCLPLIIHGKDAIIGWFLAQLYSVERRLKSHRRPKKIILIRHGQSMANLDSTLYQKIPDNQIELSPLGQKQSLIAGENLRLILGDESIRFYVSPYMRSKQTLEGIIIGGNWKKGDYTIREEPRLREQDWGNYQDPKEIEKVQKERRSFGAFYYRMPHGESGADVWDRVTSVWDSIHREFADRTSQNYVLVTHGLTIRLFLMRYYQWPVSQFNELWNPDNCQFAVMELQPNGKYRLWQNKDWEKKKNEAEKKSSKPN